MRHLAIETSSKEASLAVFRDNEVQNQKNLPPDTGTLESLIPTIQEICAELLPLEFLSVSMGPGSFTGLRLGIMTAKMLSFGWNIPVVSVGTLDAIAWQILHDSAVVTPQGTVVLAVMNAYRGQVFVSANQVRSDARLELLCAATVLDAETWRKNPTGFLQESQDLSRETQVVVTGPGLDRSELRPNADSNTKFQIAPSSLWTPRALSIGLMGRKKFQKGNVLNAIDLHPNYVRRSAAEEKLNSNVK